MPDRPTEPFAELARHITAVARRGLPLDENECEVRLSLCDYFDEYAAQAARKIAAIYGFPQHHEEALQILNDTFRG